MPQGLTPTGIIDVAFSEGRAAILKHADQGTIVIMSDNKTRRIPPIPTRAVNGRG